MEIGGWGVVAYLILRGGGTQCILPASQIANKDHFPPQMQVLEALQATKRCLPVTAANLHGKVIIDKQNVSSHGAGCGVIRPMGTVINS